MGLDNFPYRYPCKSGGTAVLDDQGRIDCQATQAAGGCPWQENTDRPQDEAVLGMLGTSCWLRGKYYNHVLRLVGLDDNEFSLYGDNEDGTYKSPRSCREVAEGLRAAEKASSDRDILLRLANLEGAVEDPEQAVAQVRADAAYAAWWLDWVADTGGGSACWY